jgi:hypothetical protein
MISAVPRRRAWREDSSHKRRNKDTHPHAHWMEVCKRSTVLVTSPRGAPTDVSCSNWRVGRCTAMCSWTGWKIRLFNLPAAVLLSCDAP